MFDKIKGFKTSYYSGYRLIVEVENIYDIGITDIKKYVKEIGISIKFRSYNDINLQRLYQYISKENIIYIDNVSKKVYVKDVPADCKKIYYETNAIILKYIEPTAKISKSIQRIYRDNRQQIEKFRKQIAVDIHKTALSSNKYILFTCLGGASEIGRSAYILRTANSAILIDCGIKLIDNLVKYPYFTEIDLSTVTAIVITHAHADHCYALPLLYKSGYKGPVYMTSGTQKLVAMAHLDTIDKQNELPLYTITDIKQWIKKTHLIGYHKWCKITPDIKVLFTPSNHILGSTMVNIEAYGKYLLHTADYKLRKDNILPGLKLNIAQYEVLISEGTYFNDTRRAWCEEQLVEFLINIIISAKANNAYVLVPVLAIGRGQEFLYYLHKIFTQHPQLKYPVFIDGCIEEVTNIYYDEIAALDANLRNSILNRDSPFQQQYLQYVKDRNKVFNIPSIIITTSGMFEGGPIMYYFEKLAQSELNTILITTAQITTTGKSIKQKQKHIKYVLNGKPTITELKARVYNVPFFSGHATEKDLVKFIKKIKPKKLIITHTETKNVQIATKRKIIPMQYILPKNLETYRLL